jgi:hypothetical protein
MKHEILDASHLALSEFPFALTLPCEAFTLLWLAASSLRVDFKGGDQRLYLLKGGKFPPSVRARKGQPEGAMTRWAKAKAGGGNGRQRTIARAVVVKQLQQRYLHLHVCRG